jgi:hypothetical protein
LGYHEWVGKHVKTWWNGWVPCKGKLLLHMPNWKPSCFIMDVAPQELWALQ